jgi:hypothetical protein
LRDGVGDVQRYEDKESFLDALGDLRPDLFFPEGWDQGQRDKAVETIKPRSTRASMFTSIPMKCHGDACPFAESCPLLAQNLAPLNKPCPLEMAMVQQFMSEYMEELGVDADNLIEVSMLRDLVDQEVQYLRKTKILSQEHFITENVVGVDPQGQVVMRKELHLAVELEDKLHRRKKDLRNQLLATREARARVGQTQLDTAQAISNIMDHVRDLEAEKERTLRRAMGTLYKDDYIAEAEVIPSED